MNKAGDAALNALQLVTACRARLDKLNRAMQQRQWQRASDIAAEYSLLLKRTSEVQGSPVAHDELVQLNIYHRRTMRLLSSHMTDVNEDIQSLESGQQSARRNSAWATAIHSQ